MTDSDRTPVPQPEKVKTDFKIAYISAGSALLGALVGALASAFIAVHQIDSQHKESVDDFLRTQQQTVYALVLNDHHQMQDDEEAYWLTLPTTLDSVKVAAVKAAHDKVQADDQKLRDDLDNVELVYGSLTVYKDALKVFLDHDSLFGILQLSDVESLADPAKAKADRDQYEKLSTDVGADVLIFAADARVDLSK